MVSEYFHPSCSIFFITSSFSFSSYSYLLFIYFFYLNPLLHIPHFSVCLLFWVSQFILKWIWGVVLLHHHPLFLICLIKPSRFLSKLLPHHIALHPPISLTFLAHPSCHAPPIMPLLYQHLLALILLPCPKSSSQQLAQVHTHTHMKPVQ